MPDQAKALTEVRGGVFPFPAVGAGLAPLQLAGQTRGAGLPELPGLPMLKPVHPSEAVGESRLAIPAPPRVHPAMTPGGHLPLADEMPPPPARPMFRPQPPSGPPPPAAYLLQRKTD